MFLKRITVCGFKSFCDRVDFDFGPGVTCIVGPNGCGKSNVVDAFKWVLGEQSARSLRGRQMLDMIFNGSSARTASSVAQVDLLFDNSDRALPLDLDEITVSRKLYRSGESEYLLNQGVTRLKDVRELFMDTGVGVDAYSVIEQGKVDVLLQSSPVERRIIFEEAAGISKYKARKREAERKLERTEQNLLRVADIIEELEKRLRSVKLQAGKARSYKEYEGRLNELRSRFAMAEFHRFTLDLGRLRKEVDARTDRATGLATAIERHEKDEVRVTLELDQLADRINAADTQLVQTKSNQAAQGERIEASRKRAEEQQALLHRTEQRRDTDRSRLDETRRELAEVETAVDALLEQTEKLRADMSELAEQDQSLARDLTDAQATLEDEKAGIIDLLRRSAQTHNEIVRLTTHRESLVGQRGRLATRDAQLRSELETAVEQKRQFHRRLREVEELVAEESRKLDEKKAEAARVSAVRQQLVDEIAGTKERRSALQSRRDLLDDLQRNMDGIGAGVRKVLGVKRAEGAPEWLDGVIGLVADIFEAEVAHARIIEAALGQHDQTLIVAHQDALLSHRHELGELPGRFNALCLDRLPPVLNERDFSGQEGFVARAIDLVKFDERFERVARHLLGKTIVVDSIESAVAMMRLDTSGHRYVTTGGEVIEPSGTVTLGPASSGNGLISRRSELRAIGEELDGIEARIRNLADQLNRTDAEVGHLEQLQQELRSAIYECNTAKVEAGAGLQSVMEQIERLATERPLISQEVTLLEQQIEEVLQRSDENNQSLRALEQENAQREARVIEHEDRIDAIVARRRDIQEQVTQAKVAIGQLTEKRAAAGETINALRRTMHELESSLETARHDIEQCRARIDEAQQTEAAGREQLAELAKRVEQFEGEAAQLRNTRDYRRTELDGLMQQVKASRTELGTVETERHEYEMHLAEARVRRDELTRRVMEELEIDLAEQYERYEHEEENWEQVEVEIAELRGKMERLGNVNLDAINELEELEQRHHFLTTQRDDLDESRRQLEQLIERLNQESKQRFATTFEQIRDNFRGLFRKLFGGGRADIILEDPDNVLDCGIEIVAQPPGKELQVISLMSGGEKSMTAIALLMSIFKSRPAPFAILDEVDAALDENNNDRFNHIIREFVSESQFLIITHSKRTMSIGDHLYGVTMQEPGVSTRVGVELAARSA